VGGDRVEFESTAMAKGVKVVIDRRTDAVATRELFGPQLISWLAEHPISWDQVGDLLFVYTDAPTSIWTTFDEFCDTASRVATAYWADQR
jgi:hypothetical protein